MLWDFTLSLPYERFLILCILTWFVASHYLSGECTNEHQLLLPSPHPSWSLQCMMLLVCTRRSYFPTEFPYIMFYSNQFSDEFSCSAKIISSTSADVMQKLWAFECIRLVFTLTLWLRPGGSSLPHQSLQGNSGRPPTHQTINLLFLLSSPIADSHAVCCPW